MKILIDTSIFLPSRKKPTSSLNIGSSPNLEELDILACLVSGKIVLTQKFQNNQLTYLQETGVHKPLNDRNHISKSGSSFVVDEIKISFARIQMIPLSF